MPVRPSSGDTAPSCITPGPESDGSSSCRASRPPAEALVLERPPHPPRVRDRDAVVAEARAPARASSASSVSSAALRPPVIAAKKPTRIARVAAGLVEKRARTGGVVDHRRGVRHRGTQQKPPAAAARVPDARSSWSSPTQHPQMHVRIHEARERRSGPRPSIVSVRDRVGVRAASSAIWPSRITRSCSSSTPGPAGREPSRSSPPAAGGSARRRVDSHTAHAGCSTGGRSASRSAGALPGPGRSSYRIAIRTTTPLAT